MMYKESDLITDENEERSLLPFMVAIVHKARKDEVRRRGYTVVCNQELNKVFEARFGFNVEAWTYLDMMVVVDAGKFNDTVGKWWGEIRELSERGEGNDAEKAAGD